MPLLEISPVFAGLRGADFVAAGAAPDFAGGASPACAVPTPSASVASTLIRICFVMGIALSSRSAGAGDVFPERRAPGIVLLARFRPALHLGEALGGLLHVGREVRHLLHLPH